jgi:hypothetical protein
MLSSRGQLCRRHFLAGDTRRFRYQRVIGSDAYRMRMSQVCASCATSKCQRRIPSSERAVAKQGMPKHDSAECGASKTLQMRGVRTFFRQQNMAASAAVAMEASCGRRGPSGSIQPRLCRGGDSRCAWALSKSKMMGRLRPKQESLRQNKERQVRNRIKNALFPLEKATKWHTQCCLALVSMCIDGREGFWRFLRCALSPVDDGRGEERQTRFV